MSYQDVVNLTEDRKPQNPIQDNMENYRKLLSLGKQVLLSVTPDLVIEAFCHLILKAAGY